MLHYSLLNDVIAAVVSSASKVLGITFNSSAQLQWPWLIELCYTWLVAMLVVFMPKKCTSLVLGTAIVMSFSRNISAILLYVLAYSP